MKVLHTIKIKNNGIFETIDFGIANTPEEEKETFSLRYKIYVEKKNYIPLSVYTEPFDIDEYDQKHLCTYIIARHNKHITGLLRIIQTNQLPILDHYFSFTEPKVMKDIQINKKVEMGRLISSGKFADGSYIPRHIIMLGMFYATGIFLKNSNIEGVYGALKLYIYNKIKKINLPLKRIYSYNLIFEENNKKDPLKNFFNNVEDPVIPTYILVKDAMQYLESFFNSRIVFKKESESIRYFRGNIFMGIFLLLNKFRFL